jgi:hypothetical protein
MSIKIDLPHELEVELTNEAAQFGMGLEDYIGRLLAGGKVLVPDIRSGQDLVAYWQAAGVIGSRRTIRDSQKHARRLRSQVERRRRG